MDDLDEEVPEAEKERLIKQVMKERHESLGPMTAHELSVFVCFITVIILWFFRRPLFMPGKYLCGKQILLGYLYYVSEKY